MRTRSTTVDRQVFPVDEWALVQVGTGSSTDAHDSLFAISNGVFGLRTPIRAQRSAALATTIVNRFYETFDITYPEEAYGLARTGQSLVPGPDLSFAEIEIDGHRYGLDAADWVRRVDFSTGCLIRTFRLPLGTDAIAVITHTAFVSQASPHEAFQRWTVNVDNGNESHDVAIVLHVQHPIDDSAEHRESDPRQGRRFSGDAAPVCELSTIPDGIVSTVSTRRSQQQLKTSLRTNAVQCNSSVDSGPPANGALVVRGEASQQQPFEATVVITLSGITNGDEAVNGERDGVNPLDFDRAFAQHRLIVERFWSRADIRISGNPSIQQAVRWHLFQLFQASPSIDGLGISAKGQTALGYDGHYFWDTEVFMLPFLAHSVPDRARRLLEVRHQMLPSARDRAATMSQHGVLFPWRTLNGEEASAYYPAGTAQYHINADIAWAVDTYLSASGDHKFLTDAGAEIVIETARMWSDLAFEDEHGLWHIHGVTGPDEYSAVVDDNSYTNVMAARNLRLAANIVQETPHLAHSATVEEVDQWHLIADGLIIPFDSDRGIYAQDAHFLSRKRWELSDIAEDQHPLLLHLHPLVIYRHQLIKQADLVLAMLLAPEAFQPDALHDTFMYYEEITTGDSSLSAAIQATVAAQVGEIDRAAEHFNQALFLDIADTHNNTSDGIHLANSGGIWTAIVAGMAGISLNARGLTIAPTGWCAGEEISALLPLRSSLLELTIKPEGTTVRLRAGEAVALFTPNREISVHDDPVFIPAVFP